MVSISQELQIGAGLTACPDFHGIKGQMQVMHVVASASMLPMRFPSGWFKYAGKGGSEAHPGAPGTIPRIVIS